MAIVRLEGLRQRKVPVTPSGCIHHNNKLKININDIVWGSDDATATL
jgi:hypothetical protein